MKYWELELCHLLWENTIQSIILYNHVFKFSLKTLNSTKKTGKQMSFFFVFTWRIDFNKPGINVERVCLGSRKGVAEVGREVRRENFSEQDQCR